MIPNESTLKKKFSKRDVWEDSGPYLSEYEIVIKV